MTDRPGAAPVAQALETKLKDLTIVVVSYNTRDLLARCLENALGAIADLDADVVVVDNASADGSADMVVDRFPSVRLIQNRENRGFASANNQGLHRAQSEFMLLLNSDAFIHKAALETLVRFMQRRPQAGVCGAQLIERDGRIQPPPVHFPTPLSGLFNMTAFRRWMPRSRHNVRPASWALKSDEPRRVDWVSGACFMVRRQAILDVGLLDEGYFLYFEETDWCRRMTEHCWEIWYLPAARVRHVGGSSVDPAVTTRPFQTYHPRHMLDSRRRHMRQYYGLGGMLLTEALDVSLYGLQVMKNIWRPSRHARKKARSALEAIAIILGLKRVGV